MSVATRFFQLLCNKAIPVSSTGMTPFVVNSLLLYGLAAILNGYKLAVTI
ncbi:MULTISPECIES: hypothetical protein [unclassified Wolbachia]|nr:MULTISPECIES: hypothetical protein [unclassified Wolbachia]